MKQLKLEAGGRPFTNDDLALLQQELTDALQAPFFDNGPFILSGCEVSGVGPAYHVAAGIVCLGGQLLRFAGAGAVALPMQFQAGATVNSDPRPYQTGGTKCCAREVPAVLVAADPTYTDGDFVPLHAWGGRRWAGVVRASVRSLGEVQAVAHYTPADYVPVPALTNGLGKPGTEAWGWALCNGLNGTADLRGAFTLGHNPNKTQDGRGGAMTLNSVGDQGGEERHTLSVAELPVHAHGINDGYLKQQGNAVSGASGGGAGASAAAGTTAGAGADQAHNNMPPYYVVVYRQWVGYS